MTSWLNNILLLFYVFFFQCTVALTLNMRRIRLINLAIRVDCTIRRWVIAVQLLHQTGSRSPNHASRPTSASGTDRHCCCGRCYRSSGCCRRSCCRGRRCYRFGGATQCLQLVERLGEAVDVGTLAQAQGTVVGASRRTCKCMIRKRVTIFFFIF